MRTYRQKKIGRILAHLLHTTIGWDEPLSKNDIEELVKSFEKELKILNGKG